MSVYKKLAVLLFGLYLPGTAFADSSSPTLAGYYDVFMAICNGSAYSWEANGTPQRVMDNARKVAVGANNRYVLSSDGNLYAWETAEGSSLPVMQDVLTFYAGRSGLLIIRNDNSLWHIPTKSFLGFGEKLTSSSTKIAENVGVAAVGDSANYYASLSGELYVKGKAHRGQYGNGELIETADFIKTAEGVIQIAGHTGHALILKGDGTVWGTGGNIYGPIGRHGLGDKAVRWSKIIDNTIGIATGSSHSLAITKDRKLWIWGRKETIKPRVIMTNVDAVAAGNNTNIMLKDGFLWQWDTGSLPEKKLACP